MDTIYIKPGWRCTLDFTPKNAAGDEVPVDGPVNLTTIEGAEFIESIERLGDRQFKIVAAEDDGVATMEVSGDADLNGTVSNIATTFSVVVEEPADHFCVEASAFASGGVE